MKLLVYRITQTLASASDIVSKFILNLYYNPYQILKFFKLFNN